MNACSHLWNTTSKKDSEILDSCGTLHHTESEPISNTLHSRLQDQDRSDKWQMPLMWDKPSHSLGALWLVLATKKTQGETPWTMKSHPQLGDYRTRRRRHAVKPRMLPMSPAMRLQFTIPPGAQLPWFHKRCPYF